jgi:cysteine desulfurase
MKRIYLDHSATTPVSKEVLKAMLPYFTSKFGNPSSVHTFGQVAAAGVEKSREQAAKFLNASPDEIIFTSGSTEANNLAIKGIVAAIRRSNGNKKIHVITSVIEHDSVLEPFAELERTRVEVSHLPVNTKGVVNINDLKNAIKENTALVSVMYVNSEVGSIQPIREIGKMIHKLNERKLKAWLIADSKTRGEKPTPVYFHTDATQAVNFLNCDAKANYLDALSLSGHKIYGPKGVGLLYLKKGTPIIAQQSGGHHELNRRSGTLNVPGIVGLGMALEQLRHMTPEKTGKKIAIARDLLVKGLLKAVPDLILNTDLANSTPAHAHFSFLGVEGESILIALDMAGVAVSTGSACASNSLKASHVLVAMGIPVEVAHNSIRFTLGKNTTETEIRTVLKKLPPIINRLRKISTEYKLK